MMQAHAFSANHWPRARAPSPQNAAADNNDCSGGSGSAYPIPPGYTSANEAQNRYVNDPKGNLVVNPNYQQTIDSFRWNVKGIALAFGKLAFGVASYGRSALASSTNLLGSFELNVKDLSSVKDALQAGTMNGVAAAKAAKDVHDKAKTCGRG